MFDFLFAKKSTGIYIGSGKVAVMEAGYSLAGVKVENFSEISAVKKYDEEDSILDISDNENNVSVQEYSDALNKLLIENNVSKENVSLILPSKDIMVRYFTLPKIPKNELPSTVKFEAKKYIPFNIDEVYSDFHVISWGNSKKDMEILFAAVKKDLVDEFTSVLNNCGISPESIRIPGISLLNLVSKYQDYEKKKKNFTYMLLDLNEEVITITVFRNGIPYLIRDFSMQVHPESQDKKISDASFDTLLHEIHLSFEYFYSQFPADSVLGIYCFNCGIIEDKMNKLTEEFDVPIIKPDLNKIINSQFDLSDISSNILFVLAASFERFSKKIIDINLLPESSSYKMDNAETKNNFFIPRVIVVEVSALLIGLLILYVVIGEKMMFSIEEQISSVNSIREKINKNYKNMSNKQLNKAFEKAVERRRVVNPMINDRVFLTEKLNKLVISMPREVWIESLTFEDKQTKEKSDGFEMYIEGMIFSEGAVDDMDVISQYLRDLKNDSLFIEGFSKINLTSIKKSQVKGFSVTNFKLHCH